ncbi:sulfotransferase domain-containing protein [Sphingomonas quercus]|uniref:Sulfotransferase domain-containing protein n=1 Tax=Sphingomonas quercus TaxID=2842451 RepID=A0ABS6BIC7_9SPHN|nr:sulfotransferase domain-containing protein [Sphingomonas quercus]
MTAGKVAFLVAGVQKGGTSALFEYLRGLPDLVLPDVKEAHFFDDETRVDWASPDYAPYHALFPDDGRLRGEATPIYLYWPPALERIARYNPEMKLILLFRDPVARAWSQWQMEYAKRKETEPFAWCIRDGRRRMADALPFPGHHRVFSYVERGFYGSQLARALSLFPRGQLLLLRSADLKSDPDAVLARIADFLGIARPAGRIAPRLVRVAPDIAYPSRLEPEDVAYLQRIYLDEMDRFASLGGPDLFGN